MKIVVSYIFIFFLILCSIFYLHLADLLPEWILKIKLLFECIIIGGFGGIVYCFRAIYLNSSVKKVWDNSWNIWYIIRPFVSLIMGAVSFLFLKAGLIVFEASQNPDASFFAFYALSFIAGLNVDNFISKIESIAQSTWGIEKSRASKEE